MQTIYPLPHTEALRCPCLTAPPLLYYLQHPLRLPPSYEVIHRTLAINLALAWLPLPYGLLANWSSSSCLCRSVPNPPIAHPLLFSTAGCTISSIPGLRQALPSLPPFGVNSQEVERPTLRLSRASTWLSTLPVEQALPIKSTLLPPLIALPHPTIIETLRRLWTTTLKRG